MQHKPYAYLVGGLSVSDDGLADEVSYWDVSIAARDNHADWAKADRDFHDAAGGSSSVKPSIQVRGL